ncbi:hypothetical protein [Flavobacterium macacae]|uniref:Uncharacterized protein n=1 Tax=Flavobacterium macacae TaxID=2488993 RepID=A0A3P3WGZ2_9FLAO|nr:hypothetical protein [Flavobacterium macacae]RRJ92949.1 hypothetical protein EG849_05005 [Flavobacterium macacae]
MKNFLLLFVCLFSISKIVALNNQIFTIKSKIISFEELVILRKKIDSVNEFKTLYDDDRYSVRDSCRGEFGGWVKFKDKKTKFEYIFESTCALMINKFKGKYIVTGTLNHMGGFTKIYEITNPLLLKKINRGEKIIFQKIGNKGAKILVNKFGMTTLFTFEYNKRLFHIVSNSSETFISEIENGAFKKIQSLYNKEIHTIIPRILNSDNSSKIFFNDYTVKGLKGKGYFEVDKNNITVFTVE